MFFGGALVCVKVLLVVPVLRFSVVTGEFGLGLWWVAF